MLGLLAVVYDAAVSIPFEGDRLNVNCRIYQVKLAEVGEGESYNY